MDIEHKERGHISSEPTIPPVLQALVKKLRKDFKFVTKLEGVEAVLLYGSWVAGEVTSRSDIDVCIIAPDSSDLGELFSKVLRGLHNAYDVRIFENLPLHIKMNIIEQHLVISAENILDLYEYFYSFRKIWKDQRERNAISSEEARELLRH